MRLVGAEMKEISYVEFLRSPRSFCDQLKFEIAVEIQLDPTHKMVAMDPESFSHLITLVCLEHYTPHLDPKRKA